MRSRLRAMLGVSLIMSSVFAMPEAMTKPLVNSGPALLEKLGIQQVALLSDGHYFGLPQTVWGFTAQQGFKQLLQQLEKNPQPFQQIEIWGGQFLLSGERASQQVVLWIKRHAENQFSGTLTLWGIQQDKSTGGQENIPSIAAPTVAGLSQLPIDAQVLLDMSTEQPNKARQWIYLLPFTVDEAQRWLSQLLNHQHWRELPAESGLQVWQRQHEQLQYRLEDIEGNTALYVVKKHIKKSLVSK